MKKKFFVMVVLALSMVLLFVSCGLSTVSGSNASKAYSFQQEPEMTVTKVTIVYDYKVEIKGILQNNTSRVWTSATISFAIYDSEGNNMGTASDSIQNLGPEETWKFEANKSFESDEAPVTFKFVKVTYY